MKRLTIKQIRLELRKLKTFDEKKNYLEEILDVAKGKNLREEIKKILAELREHLESGNKLSRGDALEQKLTKSGTEIEAEESQVAASARPITETIKYAKRRAREEESPLEQTARTAPAGGAGAAAERRYVPGKVAYQSTTQAISNLQARLSEVGLVRKFNPDTFLYMAQQDRDKVFEVAREYFGMPDSMSESQYSQLNYVVRKMFGSEKEEKEKEKYKIRH